MALTAHRDSATLIAFPGAASGMAAPLIAAALKAHRLPELLAAQLLRAAGRPADAQTGLTTALATRMTHQPLDLKSVRGILLIGASGAGKSAAAAGIAAAAQTTGREVLLMSAHEGLPRFRAGDVPANALMVMEADGFHPLNPRARAAFASLSEIEDIEPVGIVSALADAEDVADMVAAFRFHRVIVTGLDRTRRLGALTAAVTGCAQLAHVVRGPDGTLSGLEPADLAAALLAPLSQ